MKMNCWLILGTMLATTAVAQVSTNALPEIPPPANAVPAPVGPAVLASTNAIAPAVKKPANVKHKKRLVKKLKEPTVTLVPGPAVVASANLNLRGQAGMKGEVVGHLKAGDSVTVISQINLDKHAADEPTQWAKLALPSGTKVWVFTKFVDTATKTVSAKKLNLRAGPGENYSVLGVLEKGSSVSALNTKGDWTQIETPANAFAFAAAMYLKQEAVPVEEPTNSAPTTVETPVATTPAPPATTNTVAEAPPIVTQPEATTPTAAVIDTNAAAQEVDTNPPPPRVATHEGYVRPSVSLVAPTYYELYDTASGNAINYLYTTSTNLDLSRYNNYEVIVTGEEGISARWNDTPVMTIQKIYVVSTNPPTDYKRVSSPRASSNKRR